MALRNAADVRMNTSSTMRPSHSSLSRSVIEEIVGGQQSTVYSQQEDGSGAEPIFAHPNRQSPAPGFLGCQSSVTDHQSLLQRWWRIIRQLVLARVRALHFELVKKQRRADDCRRNSAGPVAHERVIAGRDQIAA